MSRVKGRTATEVCADCSAPDPTWASINRGVLICDECCSVHRSLGRHISQIKSLNKGQWSPTLLSMVQHLANHGANSIWEHSLLDPSQSKHGKKKPGPRDQVHPVKAEFIRSKYQFLQFINKQKDGDVNSIDDLSKQLHSSVRTSNLETCLRLLSKGADPNYFHPEKGNCPLHVAAQSGQPLQVELLVIYGADPGAFDSNGKTPIDHAKAELYIDLADRILELHYELTDRLAYYVCKRKPDHKNGIHFIIPEMADSSLDLSELAKQAKLKLQALPNHLFEELAMDVYDEVDRRENDEHWSQSHDNSAVVSDRQGVPFLPLNPDFSATRNQGRQKLARFNAREFTTLVIDILSDAKRRQTGAMSPTQTPKEQDIQQSQCILNQFAINNATFHSRMTQSTISASKQCCQNLSALKFSDESDNSLLGCCTRIAHNVHKSIFNHVFSKSDMRRIGQPVVGLLPLNCKSIFNILLTGQEHSNNVQQIKKMCPNKMNRTTGCWVAAPEMIEINCKQHKSANKSILNNFSSFFKYSNSFTEQFEAVSNLAIEITNQIRFIIDNNSPSAEIRSGYRGVQVQNICIKHGKLYHINEKNITGNSEMRSLKRYPLRISTDGDFKHSLNEHNIPAMIRRLSNTGNHGPEFNVSSSKSES
ncbi:G protein-coupled receptor kinase interactor 2, partial [Mytilus galloprovincialis]